MKTLPFPVAFPLDYIDAARNPPERYQRLLFCYEALVRYCAAVQLSDYLANGCPNPTLNKQILDRLGQNFSLGHWVELTAAITRMQADGALPAFVPEIAAFYFKPGKRSGRTAEGDLFHTVLLAARNEWAHPNQTWTAETFKEKFREQKPMLDALIGAVAFLGEYALYVPVTGPRPGLVTEALLLMGPSEYPKHLMDLAIPLTPRVLEHLEYGSTAFLTAPGDPARQLLLGPLSLFVNRDGSEDIFLFDGCDLRKQILRRLYYRAVRADHKPLEIAPGSAYTHLVEQFRKLLGVLEEVAPPKTAPAPTPVVAKAESSGLYFAAQQAMIRERVAGFVGRHATLAEIDDFLAVSPRGYLLLRAGPGQGKSAVACRMIQTLITPHHLITATGGRSAPHLIVGSLLSQLLAKFPDAEAIPDGPQERIKLFEDLLAAVGARGDRLVIVIDGLDELTPDVGDPPPFLPTDSLPDGVFFLVTSRPGDRLDRLRDALGNIPARTIDLPPLELAEIGEILRARRPGIGEAEIERIAVACQGNPLYLHAVADELARNPNFPLAELPPSVEGFFRHSTDRVFRGGDSLGRDVLGLLAVAREPLSDRELGLITGRPTREIRARGIAPIRQFLYVADDGYAFYHARFRDFVFRDALSAGELPGYHRMIAEWLGKPASRELDYRWEALAHHLSEAGDRDGLLKAIDRTFLEAKVRRFGYGVLEDIELVAKVLLAEDDPAALERCVELVESLRAAVGGDVIGEARWEGQVLRPVGGTFRSKLVEPAVERFPGADIYVGMLPKIEVGADFFEAIPVGDRLVLVLGDAPGTGLKPAFVARFLGNLVRRSVARGNRRVAEVVAEVNAAVERAAFDPVAAQIVEIAPGTGRVRIANAGIPFPALYRARRGRTDLLPVYGSLIGPVPSTEGTPVWDDRQAEVEPGDVLVLMTDGFTESKREDGDEPDRFARYMIPGRTAREIGQAILDDWRAGLSDHDYTDDATIVVVAFPNRATEVRR